MISDTCRWGLLSRTTRPYRCTTRCGFQGNVVADHGRCLLEVLTLREHVVAQHQVDLAFGRYVAGVDHGVGAEAGQQTSTFVGVGIGSYDGDAVTAMYRIGQVLVEVAYSVGERREDDHLLRRNPLKHASEQGEFRIVGRAE